MSWFFGLNIFFLIILLYIAEKVRQKLISRMKGDISVVTTVIFLISVGLWYYFPQSFIAPLAVMAMGGWVYFHMNNEFLHMGFYPSEVIPWVLLQIGLTVQYSYLFYIFNFEVLLVFAVICFAVESFILLVSIIILVLEVFVDYLRLQKRKK